MGLKEVSGLFLFVRLGLNGRYGMRRSRFEDCFWGDFESFRGRGKKFGECWVNSGGFWADTCRIFATNNF